MAIRIVGVDLPQNKRGEIALTYIFGIGRSSSAKILEKAGVDKDLKVKDWSDDQAAKIREIIGADYKVEGDLRSEIQLNIKRLMDIGCYRGIRHRIGLPVRGQSTKNNARTRKGLRDSFMFTHHSTTLLLLWQTVRARLFHGLLQVKWALEVPRRILLMQHRWPLKIVPRLHTTWA